MFDELPKLFERGFFIGYFVPAAALSGALVGTLSAFCLLDLPETLKEEKLLLGATSTVGIVWLVAVTLMAVNRQVIRFLEGYPKKWNPLKVFTPYQRWKFRGRPLEALNQQQLVDYARATGRTEPKTPPMDDLVRAVERYPDKEEWVLPTRFGNRFRASEVHSRVVYGLDAIPAWRRMQAVMPAEFRAQIDEARARLDFWVNLIVAGASCVVLYSGLAWWQHATPRPWIPFVAVASMWLAYELSLGAVDQYGVCLRSAFDLYRYDLAKQLGLEVPPSISGERKMWLEVSRVMTYRSAPAYDRLAAYRNPKSAKPPPAAGQPGP